MERKEKPVEKGPDQGWIVTFSDCMTLLLCFFVLLLTFSSFEEPSFQQMAGAFQSMSYDSLDDNPRMIPNSIVERPDRSNSVRKGANMPNDNPTTDKSPKPPMSTLASEIEKDMITFYLDSDKVFYARGFQLTHSARQYMDTMVEFFKEKNGRLVIGETSDGDLSLKRAWAVMQYLLREGSLSPKRFSVNSACTLAKKKFPHRTVVTISLLNVNIED